MEKTDPDDDEKERQSDFKQWTEDLDKQIQSAKDFLKRKESEGGELSALAELTNPTHIPTKEKQRKEEEKRQKKLSEPVTKTPKPTPTKQVCMLSF